MSEARKIFSEEIDVITIMKKLQDVEKLKRIVLNEKQLNLFNFIAKPMIYHNQEIENYKLSPNLRRIGSQISEGNSPTLSEIQDSQNVLRIYQELKNAEILEETDKRLMKIIDKDFENFVETLKNQ